MVGTAAMTTVGTQSAPVPQRTCRPGPRALLESVVDAGVIVVEAGAQADHRHDDGHRNAESDHAVFNGGRARFILRKLHQQASHGVPSPSLRSTSPPRYLELTAKPLSLA